MEAKLNQILDSIENYYFTDIGSNHGKALIVSEKWREYFMLASEYKIDIPRAYDLFLLGENNCFIVDAVNEIPHVFIQDILDAVNNLQNVLERRANNEEVGISYDDAILLLKWAISNTRKQIASFGVDVVNNSLNGFCDFSQISSLLPFENIGLAVTKNAIEDVFGSVNHHVFGTVTFPIIDGDKVEEETFLVDPTYRQFFTATRCNEGRYFVALEDLNPIGPDPGYFMDDDIKIEFANSLITNGFILFNEENAKIYGDAFSYSNVSIDDVSKSFPIIEKTSGRDYINKIRECSTTYSLSTNDLEEYGFSTNFPGVDEKNSKLHF